MIITKAELQTLIDGVKIQLRIGAEEFRHLITTIILAVRTGTEPELCAAYDSVTSQEAAQTAGGPDYNAPVPGMTAEEIIAEARSYGIKLGIDPAEAEAAVRKVFGISYTGGPASDPLGTELYPNTGGPAAGTVDPASQDTVTVSFLGPDTDPVPGRCIVTMPESFNRLPETVQQAILGQLDVAKSLCAACVVRYDKAGTFPAGTVKPGQTFREYATDLITRAAQN